MSLSAASGSPPDPSRSGRRLVRALCAGLAFCALWAGVATWYLVFHDEVLARFVSQQSAMQYGYEERIGLLRTQLDRSAMEQLATREGLATRLGELSQRQAAMEKRQALLSTLAGDPTRLPLDASGPDEAPAALPVQKRPAAAAKPIPTPDALELRMRDGDDAADTGRQSMRGASTTLAGLEHRLDALGAAQIRTLDVLGVRSVRGAQRLRSLVMRAGLDPQRFERQRETGLGGPLIPVAVDPFGIAAAQVQRSLGDEERLRRITQALPLRRPIAGEFSLSSGFGTRLDPFTRGLAMHTGLDMRAEFGEPARATAAGRVTTADYAGGYGNMVEVDHGNGLSTRYAHLSTYVVSPGQWVEPGAILGRVGSTGRSTGSHLHYETRIDGDPVDPQRFLRAADPLDAMTVAGR